MPKDQEFSAGHQRRNITSPDMQQKLRRVAERVGIIAPWGPKKGKGSALGLIDALDRGDVVCLRLDKNEQAQLVALLQYAVKFRKGAAELVAKVEAGLT